MKSEKDNDIKLFFHCKKCVEENKDSSPKEYSRIEAGWTDKGLQVRCVRHDLNIINLDFLGQKVDYV